MNKGPTHLHLGCGLTTPPGWLNVDGSWQPVLARYPLVKTLLVGTHLLPRKQAEIPWSAEVIRLDLTRPLPFTHENFEAVYSSHTLEHLYYEDALGLLKECHRILKPGGVCRIVVPDLESLVARYQKAKEAGDPEAATRLMEELLVHTKSKEGGILGLFHGLTGFHQHKWMYDSASMKRLFERAGFGQVRRADYLDSRIARIAEVEDRNRILDGQGVAVEGIRE